jgi:hypothetical protein
MILQLAQIDLKLITKVLREGISFKLVFPSIASLFLPPFSVLWLLYAPKAKAQSAKRLLPLDRSARNNGR